MEVTGPVNDPAPPGQHARQLLAGGQLACGADVNLLLEQAADGNAGQLMPHQRDCVHCQAALAEFTALWAPVRDLAATPVPPPAGLTAAVLSQIRGLIRDVWYTLQGTSDGAIRVATRVVATIARDSARQVTGVRVALGRASHGRAATLAEASTLRHHHPHAAVGVLGRTAVIDLAIAVTYDHPVRDTARHVQQQVIRTLRDNPGLQAITVNVTVDDIVNDS